MMPGAAFELTDAQMAEIVARLMPPLDVVAMTCPNCGGSGESKVDASVPCIRCGGSGQS